MNMDMDIGYYRGARRHRWPPVKGIKKSLGIRTPPTNARCLAALPAFKICATDEFAHRIVSIRSRDNQVLNI